MPGCVYSAGGRSIRGGVGDRPTHSGGVCRRPDPLTLRTRPQGEEELAAVSEQNELFLAFSATLPPDLGLKGESEEQVILDLNAADKPFEEASVPRVPAVLFEM